MVTKEQVYELLTDELLNQNLNECTECDENMKDYQLGLVDGMVIFTRALVKKMEEEKTNE